MNWKKIHRWFENNLQEPFLQAELHRVRMQLNDYEAVRGRKLRVVEGGKRCRDTHSDREIEKIREAL